MRIWKGIEKEGQYRGAMTVFIESDIISKTVIETVLKLCDDSVEQLYFGAGKVPVTLIKHDAYKLLADARQLYLLTIEVPMVMTCGLLSEIFDNVILCLDMRHVPTTVKIDTGKQVYSASIKNFIANDLDTLNNGLYDDVDTLLYQDEGGN